jgi:hypothetical protein
MQVDQLKRREFITPPGAQRRRRARIQDFRVKSITSLHIVVQPAFSGWDIRPPSRVSE